MTNALDIRAIIHLPRDLRASLAEFSAAEALNLVAQCLLSSFPPNNSARTLDSALEVCWGLSQSISAAEIKRRGNVPCSPENAIKGNHSTDYAWVNWIGKRSGIPYAKFVRQGVCSRTSNSIANNGFHFLIQFLRIS